MGREAGAAGILFYGFAIAGNSVYCREGYKVRLLTHPSVRTSPR